MGDYAAVIANAAVKTEIENAIKTAVVAAAAGDGVSLADVTVALKQGSVIAEATIVPPAGVAADTLTTKMDGNAALSTGVTTALKAIPDIDSVSSGEIGVVVTAESKTQASV